MEALSPNESTSLARKVLVHERFVIEIPPGFKLAKGACCRGDLYVNSQLLLDTGEIEWMPVKPENCDRDPDQHWCAADWYALLIRPVSNRLDDIVSLDVMMDGAQRKD